VIGLGLSTVWFSHDAGLTDNSELAIEAFYKLQLTPSMSAWFDVQYIVDPGGIDADNAWWAHFVWSSACRVHGKQRVIKWGHDRQTQKRCFVF